MLGVWVHLYVLYEEVLQLSLHFGTQVLDTDQPTQVTIRFFKEVSVHCQEIFCSHGTRLCCV